LVGDRWSAIGDRIITSTSHLPTEAAIGLSANGRVLAVAVSDSGEDIYGEASSSVNLFMFRIGRLITLGQPIGSFGISSLVVREVDLSDDGMTVAIAGRNNIASMAYVYRLSGEFWPMMGQTIVYKSPVVSISLSGSQLAIGSDFVYEFSEDSNKWLCSFPN
jgi:hypothetical protein